MKYFFVKLIFLIRFRLNSIAYKCLYLNSQIQKQIMNKNYHLKQTWQEKYNLNNCQKYDWIQSASESFAKIKQLLPEDKDIHILELGCGTSPLSQLLYQAGYQKITCVDFSKRVIKQRKLKAKGIQFINADFTEPFKFDEQIKYDILIDKGSIDCLFCDEDYLRKILICIKQCYDKLKNGGKLISVSLGLPKNRKYWFRNKFTPFQVEVRKEKNLSRQDMRKNARNYNKDKEENSEDYFIYICTKPGEQPQSGKQQKNMQESANMQGLNLDSDQEEPKDQKDLQPHQQSSEEQQKNSEQEDQEQNDEKQKIKESKLKSSKLSQNKQAEDEQQEQNYQNQFDDVND